MSFIEFCQVFFRACVAPGSPVRYMLEIIGEVILAMIGCAVCGFIMCCILKIAPGAVLARLGGPSTGLIPSDKPSGSKALASPSLPEPTLASASSLSLNTENVGSSEIESGLAQTEIQTNNPVGQKPESVNDGHTSAIECLRMNRFLLGFSIIYQAGFYSRNPNLATWENILTGDVPFVSWIMFVLNMIGIVSLLLGRNSEGSPVGSKKDSDSGKGLSAGWQLLVFAAAFPLAVLAMLAVFYVICVFPCNLIGAGYHFVPPVLYIASAVAFAVARRKIQPIKQQQEVKHCG